jgi:hypothetical protein
MDENLFFREAFNGHRSQLKLNECQVKRSELEGRREKVSKTIKAPLTDSTDRKRALMKMEIKQSM